MHVSAFVFRARCSSHHGVDVDRDLLIAEGVNLKRRRKQDMMDHFCLRGPHPQPSLPPAPAAAAAAPPPLLYSSWLIIQASQQGVFASCPCPTHCQPSPSPCPEGQNRPPKPEQGLTKHFLSAYLPHRASLQTPPRPKHGSTQILNPFTQPAPSSSAEFNYIKISRLH